MSTDYDRMVDLVADFATVGLSSSEEQLLSDLRAAGVTVDSEEFEFAAAALDRGFTTSADSDELPVHLRERIMTDARAFISQAQHPLRLAGTEADTSGTPDVIVMRRNGILPWFAAAAAILLAAFAWWPASEPSIRDMVDGAPDEQVTRWANNDAGITGEVHWSPSLQNGYLTFTGLDVNDPESVQYQLWIFDAQRNPRFNAVDGGVFNIEQADGTVIVPINAKLGVADPALFAITTEPPGGVVKHDPELDPERFRIILTAEPDPVG